MDVTPVLAKGAPAIESYGPEGFYITGQLHSGAVVVTPEGVRPLAVASYDALQLVELESVFTASPKPDVLLLGTGASCDALPPKEWRARARAVGVVMEAMNTAAACRTWNVLLLEGRRVSAVLFPL